MAAALRIGIVHYKTCSMDRKWTADVDESSVLS
jgi:hypothetical protein